MTAAQAISDLDAALARVGEDVIVRRYTAPSGDPRPKTDITVRGSVRAVKPEQLVGNIDQTSSNVALSPTGLGALLPLRKGDKAVVQGKERNIEIVKLIVMGGVLVRINLVVLG